MAHKYHIQHTADNGPACQRGRSGAALRGEHLTVGFEEFTTLAAEQQCCKCSASKMFAFLTKKAGEWVPVEDPEAWKAADDALVAAHKARKAGVAA